MALPTGFFSCSAAERRGVGCFSPAPCSTSFFHLSFSARSTYTALTRHLSADILSFSVRRHDVFKLGTSMHRTLVMPSEAAVCRLCCPNPKFVVIDGQAIGCTVPDDVNLVRMGEDVLVLDIPAFALCVVQSPSGRACLATVLKTSALLTGPQTELLRAWHNIFAGGDPASAETAAANVFFHFFTFADRSTRDADGGASTTAVNDGDASSAPPAGKASSIAGLPGAAGRAVVDGTASTPLEATLRTEDDGNLTLGGKGSPAKLPSESWRERVSHCAPDIGRYAKEDGEWLHIRPFLSSTPR